MVLGTYCYSFPLMCLFRSPVSISQTVTSSLSKQMEMFSCWPWSVVLVTTSVCEIVLHSSKLSIAALHRSRTECATIVTWQREEDWKQNVGARPPPCYLVVVFFVFFAHWIDWVYNCNIFILYIYIYISSKNEVLAILVNFVARI